MKIRHGAAWLLGACVALGSSPMGLHAQSSTATTGSGTSSGANAGGAGGGGGGGAASTTGINLNQSSGLVQPVAIQAATNTASSATTAPSTSNNLYYTYVNPTSLGLPTLYASNLGPPSKYTGTMGKGLYLNNATTTTSGAASTTSNAGVGFSTQPTPRSPAYYTVLGEGLTPPRHTTKALSLELKQKFATSTRFKKGDAIQVEVGTGGVVFLRGQVTSDTERARAEGMMRITPGVNEVQNELQVVPLKN